MVRARRFSVVFWGLLIFSSHLFSFAAGQFTISNKGDEFNTFLQNGKVGLKSPQGQVLIPAEYDAVGWSNGELSVINNVTGFRLGDKWGLLNLQNNKITKAEFHDLIPVGGELVLARKTITGTVRIATGCISTAGKQVIPFEYDGIKVQSLRAIVYKKSGNEYRYGLIDLQNRPVIPIQFANIYPLGSLRFAVENFEHKTGIFADEGRQVFPFSIDSISRFKKDVAVFFENERQGVITRDGSIKIDAIYEQIRINDDGSISGRKPNRWSWLDLQSGKTNDAFADSVVIVDDNLLKVTNNGISTLTDVNYTSQSGGKFRWLGSFKKHRAIFADANGKYGVISSAGKVIVNAKYEVVLHRNSNYLARSRARWTMLDSTGRELTQKPYQFIGGSTNSNFFPAQLRGYWGRLDQHGTEILACAYDSLIQIFDDLVVVKFRGKYGVITTGEQWLLSPSQDKFQLVARDKYLQKAGSTTQLKSFNGDLVYFSENPLLFKNGYLWEYQTSGAVWKINLDGSVADRNVQPAEVVQPFVESEGLTGMQRDGQYGFVDSRGRLRIANRYEGVKDFSENLAAIKIRGKWGFINHQDNIAIQPVYEDVSSFVNGHAIVRQKSMYGVIDKQGKVVLPMRYEAIIRCVDFFKIRQGGFWGIADLKGNTIINPKFDDVTALSQGNFMVRRDGKFGVLNSSGVSVVPLIYDQLQYHGKLRKFLALSKSEWEQL